MFGTEEGEVCGRGGCKGTIVLEPVENCSCHIAPPCSECVERRLVCSDCGEIAQEGPTKSAAMEKALAKSCNTTCPRCGAPAYQGFIVLECSKPNCR